MGTKFGHTLSSQTDLREGPAWFEIKHDATHDRCAIFSFKRSSNCVALSVGLLTDGIASSLKLVSDADKDTKAKPDFGYWTRGSVHLPSSAGINGRVLFWSQVAAPFCYSEQIQFWIEIDEITVLEHGCQRQLSCNFESPNCEMVSGNTFRNGFLPWLHSELPQLSRLPAPELDHTIGSNSIGGFVTVEQAAPGDLTGQAILATYWLMGTGQPMTVQFNYMLTGPESGTLEVYFTTDSDRGDGADPILAWHMNTQEVYTGEWKFGRFHVMALDEYYQIMFRATRGVNSRAIVALDDINIVDGVAAGLYPTDANPAVNLTTPQPFVTSTPVTPYPPICKPIPTFFFIFLISFSLSLSSNTCIQV